MTTDYADQRRMLADDLYSRGVTTVKKYRVILADPPWSYNNSGTRGAALNEYSTMTIDSICALPIESLADDDCVLLLWATNPLLVEALKVCESWGFKYVTKFPWIKLTGQPQINFFGQWEYKPTFGVGFWVRGCSEDVFICKRGNAKPPDFDFVGILSENFFHSRKPDNIYEYAESLPGPYLELFARRSNGHCNHHHLSPAALSECASAPDTLGIRHPLQIDLIGLRLVDRVGR